MVALLARRERDLIEGSTPTTSRPRRNLAPVVLAALVIEGDALPLAGLRSLVYSEVCAAENLDQPNTLPAAQRDRPQPLALDPPGKVRVISRCGVWADEAARLKLAQPPLPPLTTVSALRRTQCRGSMVAPPNMLLIVALEVGWQVNAAIRVALDYVVAFLL